MPIFEKRIPDRPRFPGEFYIAVDAADAGSDAQKAYVAAMDAAMHHLAWDQIADDAADYPENLRRNRNGARAAAVAAFERDAGKFIAGRNPSGDTARIDQIRANYALQIPKFGARPLSGGRFDGDFEIVIVTDYLPGNDERALQDAIRVAVAELAADQAGEVDGGFSQSIRDARRTQRINAAKLLINEIETFGANGKTAEQATVDVILLRGRYQSRRDRLTRRLFNVKFSRDGSRDGSGADGKTPTRAASRAELDIDLLDNLPPPEDAASPEKRDLYVQIGKTNTVIRTVCDRLHERAGAKSGLAMMFEGRNSRSEDHSELLRLEFLEKLAGIAIIGLQLNFLEVARLSLAELRNEFFALEAGRIKSAHSNGLALVAFLGGAALLMAYIYIWLNFSGSSARHEKWLFEHRNFLVAACGAAVGTWGSFSFRQVQFTFDDLMMLEERAISPAMRILFIVILAMATCLLFWTNAINIEIGDLKTKAQFFRESGSVALLIGLFCGLAERALATAIAGRAASFVKGVGGA